MVSTEHLRTAAKESQNGVIAGRNMESNHFFLRSMILHHICMLKGIAQKEKLMQEIKEGSFRAETLKGERERTSGARGSKAWYYASQSHWEVGGKRGERAREGQKGMWEEKVSIQEME